MNNSVNEVAYCINTLAQLCYENAKNKGFWEDEDDLIRFIEENHDGSSEQSNLINRVVSLFNSEKIALEMSELAERLETLRKGKTDMSGGTNGNFEDLYPKDEHCPEFLNIEIECADLIIRCLDFCGRRKLNIGEALIAKMKYNEGREYKHGKNF